MTATEIIIHYMKGRQEICEHDIETTVPMYGKVYFGAIYNPSTYSRKFRKLKSSGLLAKCRLSLAQEKTNSGELKYRIRHDLQ